MARVSKYESMNADIKLDDSFSNKISYKISENGEFPRNVPGDLELLKPWFDVVRHVRSKSCSGGYSVVTLRVVVDANGMPEFWVEPIVNKVSPLAKKDRVAAILSGLIGGGE